MTAEGKITTTAITQQAGTKPGVRILVAQDPQTGALDYTYRKTGAVAVLVTGYATVAGSRQCRYQLQTSAGTLTCAPSQTHWLARDKDKDALPAIAFDLPAPTERVDPDASNPAGEVPDTPEGGRFTVQVDRRGSTGAAENAYRPHMTAAELANGTRRSLGGYARVRVWEGFDADTTTTPAADANHRDAAAQAPPEPRPEPADGFGPVDAVYAPGDRISTVDRDGRASVGVVVESCDPVFKDGRTPQPWDTAYTVRAPGGGEFYVDTTRMRRELPVQIGQTWTATRSDGIPSALTIERITDLFYNDDPHGLIVSGRAGEPRGIALSSYDWAQVTSGPHPSGPNVKRCDVGEEELTGPYWLLHGYGRGWEGDRGAACAYHTGQPEPEQKPDAGPAPRDGYGRAIEALAERSAERDEYASPWSTV